jgi:hypothetical protein
MQAAAKPLAASPAAIGANPFLSPTRQPPPRITTIPGIKPAGLGFGV